MGGTDDLLASLRAAVGATHVLVGDADRSVVDWTGRFRAQALAVVRPGDAAEVAAVLVAAGAAGVPVTPRGGGTGLAGGAVPPDGGLVLDTSRLAAIGEVDDHGRVVVGAGATLAAVQSAARRSGWDVGVDLASRDSATLGGMVATDAGGARVVLHGSMRAQVDGLEAVLADGTVVAPGLGGLTKDTAGYDLRHLLVGSEGTLGLVTRVRLRLVRPVRAATTVLLGVADADAVPRAVAAVRAVVADHGARLAACELLDRDGTAAAADLQGGRSPVATAFALLVEVDVDDEELVAALADLAAGPEHVTLALDAGDAARLWALREGQAEAINRLGVPVKMDVAVPAPRFGELLRRVVDAVDAAAPGARTVLFGHAAEANVHVNVVAPSAGPSSPPDAGEAGRIEQAVVDVVASLGGTVSAEHGVGREKVPHLTRTLGEPQVAALLAVKRALDPGGLLNPGVVLPAEATRPGTGA